MAILCSRNAKESHNKRIDKSAFTDRGGEGGEKERRTGELHEVPPVGMHRNLLNHEGLGGNLNVKQARREVERSTRGGGWPAKCDLCVGRGGYLSLSMARTKGLRGGAELAGRVQKSQVLTHLSG